MTLRPVAITAALLAVSTAYADFDQTLESELTLEGRWFYDDAAYPGQRDESVSVAMQPEWYGEWNRGDVSFTVTPFVRWDSTDNARNHVDLREAYLQVLAGPLEIRGGVSKVFWGKTELLHLVDIINQDDALENIDAEDKLGQPMLRLNWTVGPGNLQGYLLPYFRERAFAGEHGRLRAPLPINDDDPVYESEDGQHHLDYAVRYQGYFGSLDYGLSWFSGTNRDPQFVADEIVLDDQQQPHVTRLAPAYGLLDQASIDAQLTLGGWLLKLEAVHRQESRVMQEAATPPDQQGPQGPTGTAADDILVGALTPVAGGSYDPDTSTIISFDTESYAAATAGFEYTFYGIAGTAIDAGALIEYLWDERGADAPTPFQNDIFAGTRITLNDVASTAILLGAVVDADSGAVFGNLEASRRFGDSTLASLEWRAFESIPDADPLAVIRQDSHLQLEVTKYF